MRVSIAGVGKVGSAVALTLVSRGLVDELVLVGRSTNSPEPHLVGEAMDLLHASAFTQPANVVAGTVAEAKGSDVIVICAAAPTVPGGDRNSAMQANADIFRQLIPALANAAPSAILLITTNPLDVMTSLALKLSGLPPARVFGTGTLLDTVRLRVLLGQRCGIHPLDIRAYVLGEHGDSQFAALNVARAGGAPLGLDSQVLRDLEEQTRRAGHEIMRTKGSSSAGVALTAMAIIQAIARDSREVIPVSTLVTGFAGVTDVCLSLPAVVGRQGVIRTLDVELTQDETRAFQTSADVVRDSLRRIGG